MNEPQEQLPIGATRSHFTEALRRGNAKDACSVYSSDARLLPPSAELMQGRAAIEAFWQAGVDAGISDVVIEPLELERRDGLAYEIGRYELRLQPATGAAVVDRGKYVLVHERQRDGSWKRAVEMFNPDVPPTSTEELPRDVNHQAPKEERCRESR